MDDNTVVKLAEYEWIRIRVFAIMRQARMAICCLKYAESGGFDQKDV